MNNPLNEHRAYEQKESIIPNPSIIPGMKGPEWFKTLILILAVVFLPVLIFLAVAAVCIRKVGRWVWNCVNQQMKKSLIEDLKK